MFVIIYILYNNFKHTYTHTIYIYIMLVPFRFKAGGRDDGLQQLLGGMLLGSLMKNLWTQLISR